MVQDRRRRRHALRSADRARSRRLRGDADHIQPRIRAGPSAYVKVADGCDHNCAFCTIPTIKGRQVSKPPLHVLQEIVDLVAHGAKEVVLVAQDTIRYGADLGIKHGLPMLLESIAEQVPNLPWVRLLYIYPTVLTLRMVDVMAEHDPSCPISTCRFSMRIARCSGR